MNINKYDEELLRTLLINYQQSTGRTRNLIYNQLFPFLQTCIKLHIYNLPQSIRQDCTQDIHILLLRRLNTIKPQDIVSIKNYFFIMVKRLVLNEISDNKTYEDRKKLYQNTFELLLSTDVFIKDKLLLDINILCGSDE